MHLATKLTISLAGAAAVAAVSLHFWTRVVYRHSLEELVLTSAERTSDIIRRGTRHAMMKNAREDLYFTIRSIGEQPGVGRVRIFNKEGRISFSTEAREVGAYVDKTAEACYACHARSAPSSASALALQAPLERLDRPDRVRYFRVNGTRVLGLINPIENEPDCSNAACHAHPASQRVLGVLDVHMPLNRVDAALASYERRTWFLSALSVLLIAGLTSAFVYELVHKPVAALIRGTGRVASGDLDYRLPVKTTDELGLLAASFNEMSRRLAAARQESRRWAETLEQRVKEKTREVETAHRHLVEVEKIASLGKMAATVAHEINNPLAGIRTYARLLSRQMERPEKDAVTQQEWKRWLEVIETESRRCGDIVRNLLTFARQVPLERKENDLNALAERCLMLVRHQMELQGIALDWKPAADVPRLVCDAAQVQQALLAILINAVEALPHGGAIRVTTARENGEARLTVADNGPGIPPEVMPHIFEPFFTTKSQGKATGLGLSVAHGIVHQHGGRIEIVSQPEQGTTFTVCLPAPGPQPLTPQKEVSHVTA